MLFEIRNYHFEPTHFEAYKKWAAADAVAYLKSKMDVVGFWVANDMEPEYKGRNKPDESEQPANITWIIRWNDRQERDEAWVQLRADPEWKAILARVPGGWRSYLRTEARFADEI